MIARVLLALAASALVAGPALAAGSDTVTVYRGAQSETVAVDARGRAVGPQARVVPEPAAEAGERAEGRGEPERPRAAAGGVLWMLDRAGDRLIACRLHKTFRVGDRDIRCRSEGLRQALLEAEARR